MKDVFIDFNVKFGLEKLWKWKWWLAGACIIAGIIAFILSSQMHKEYVSSSAFIPPSINSLNSMVFTSGLGYRGFEAAEDEDIDRAVDYLTSRQVMDTITREFKLWEHYGINQEDDNAQKFFHYLYGKKVEVTYSELSTVEVTVYDVDSLWSAQIANRYLELADNFFETISMRKKGYSACKAQLESISATREKLIDSLAALRKDLKLYHVDHVGPETDKILAAQIRSNPGFNQNYDRMVSMELQLNELEERLGDLNREFSSRKQHLDQYPTLIQITKIAKPNTYKARPKRSIYVAVAILATLLFGAFLVVILDRNRTKLPI